MGSWRAVAALVTGPASRAGLQVEIACPAVPPRRVLGLPAGGRERSFVLAISATTFLLWIGASAILPLLPSYLRAEGSSPALVGIVMAAYFAASVLTQYPLGKLSDRFGRRPLAVGGLLVFAASSIGFAAASAPGWAIVFRALQGVGAGSVTVALAAAIAGLVPVRERGGAYGALYGSQMLALAVGPLAGSVIGASSMRVLFVTAALAALVACIPIVVVLPRGAASLVQTRTDLGAGTRARAERRAAFLAHRVTLGVLIVFATAGCFGGMYETCWTLLLKLRHAASYEIGLSWTLFALPFALLSVPAGRLANRLDRRVLAIGAIVWTAGFCVVYPLLGSVAWLVGLGSLEAVGSVVGTPPALLVLSESVPSALQGAAQGAVETSRTAAMAAAAALGGALFGINTVLPFAIASVFGVVGAAAVLWCWRGLGGAASLVRANEPSIDGLPGELVPVDPSTSPGPSS